MKTRTCDFRGCNKQIQSKEPYIKLIEQKWNGKALITNHKGDMCMNCFNNNLKKNDN